MARSLVDTNVLTYSRDLNEPVKRARAIEVIDQLGAGGELALSAQCLNEFSSTSLRRGTPISEVRIAVSRWRDLGDVLALTGAATAAALTAVEQYRLSSWDALIWATARDAGVPIILSEDFQDGQEIEGVRFVNPFKQS
ncbi:MAG: PIN domain-containing protein [Acidimicrobiia bacterium]|nr:PIN domain-containing protein [Acidimicrobiia bacterium]